MKSQTPNKNSSMPPLPLLLVFIGTLAAIIFLSVVFVIKYNTHIKRQVYSELASIVDLKMSEINDWHKQQSTAARILCEDREFAENVRQKIQNPSSTDVTNRAIKLFRFLNENYDDVIMVFDIAGKKLFSYPGQSETLDFDEHQKYFQEALNKKDIVFLDFHHHASKDAVNLGYVLPIYADERKQNPLAVVYVQANPYKHLYPLLQSWPTSSKSAETLLFRVEGGNVLYLNELRHQQKTALVLKIPLSRKNVIAVQAVEKGDGIFEGVDYRGIAVVAVTRKIPNTPWIMVSKIDKSEVFNSLRNFKIVLSIAMAFAVLACLAGLFFFWRKYNENSLKASNQQLRALNQQLLAETEVRKHSEELAKESGEQFRLLFENMTEGVAMHEMLYDEKGEPIDYKVLRVNSSFEKYTKISSEKANGTLASVLYGIKKPPYLAEYASVARTRIPFYFQVYFEPMAKHFDISVISPQKGQFVTIFQDVTERKKAEEALIESEKKLSEAMKIAKIGAWGYDVASDKFTFNDQFYSLLHTTAKQEGGYFMSSAQYAQKFLHPEDLKMVGEEIKKALETTDPQYSNQTAHRVICADGQLIHILVRIRVEKDQQGRTVKTHGVNQDITERIKAEAALKESERKYRELAENINDAIFEVDEKGNITYISPSITTISGYSPEDLLGRPFEEFVKSEDMTGLERSFRDTLSNRLEPWEFRYRTKTGELRWARTSSKPIMENGRSVGIRGIFSDITKQKNMEEELLKAHKLDSLGVLAGGIAHDFNNILTGIVGNISMVRHNLEPEDKSIEMLSEAEKAVFQAKNLTLQLLTFAKGGVPVKKPTALATVISEAVTFAARGSKIKPSFHIVPDIFMVNVDPGQIAQVINNITINAVQAMPEGGDFIVTAENTVLVNQEQIPLKDGQYVRVTLKDTGPGVPKDLRVKIFDPYFTTKKTGTGLGLAASYSIIKNHDGYITVESEVGKGSSFVIYIPIFSGKIEEVGTVVGKQIKMGSGRILVLDDEPVICDVIQRILNKLGYTAECFADSLQVVARYQKTWNTPEAFDAVILDLTVPGGKGGKDAIGKLKEINPAIKAIVSSGYSNDPVIANYKEYGFCSSLAKPYNVEEVSEILYNLLAKK